MEILISNKQDDIKIDLSSFKKLAEFTLTFEGIKPLTELSIVFVDEEEIEKLNFQYRGVEEPTDVLSFSLYDKLPQGETEYPLVLGDVVICPIIAKQNAIKAGCSAEQELNMLLVHGILHLLGYEHDSLDDETIMMARQKEILNGFSQSEPDVK